MLSEALIIDILNERWTDWLENYCKRILKKLNAPWTAYSEGWKQEISAWDARTHRHTDTHKRNPTTPLKNARIVKSWKKTSWNLRKLLRMKGI